MFIKFDKIINNLIIKTKKILLISKNMLQKTWHIDNFTPQKKKNTKLQKQIKTNQAPKI